MAPEHSRLAELVEYVQASSRYRQMSEDLIRTIGAQELARRASFKEAVKAAKNKLHQVGGAYLVTKHDYAAWRNDLTHLAHSGEQAAFLAYLQGIMSHHASTRERLPILEHFYHTILADLPPVRSVLDIACGLNPLALPWMPLAGPVEYYAYDIYQDMIDFLNQYLLLLPVQGRAEVCNVIQACPTHTVDLAFVLKTLPCLEQVEKAASTRLLQTINARTIVVSFPLHSLGGRARGMEAQYTARFGALVDPAWSIKRLTFASELVFLVTKADVHTEKTEGGNIRDSGSG
jgi:16S rRNA (guanine(1405)-N(7))-methyltransferase